MFWFDRKNPDVVFADIRKESHVLCDGRVFQVAPDEVVDFTKMPFPDGRFRLVVFDPPHLDNLGANSWMAKKYGRLQKSEWREYLTKAFAECFRVLDQDGVLIFKWNESRISLAEVLKCAPYRPLFGNTGRSNKTHWVTFMKPAVTNRVSQ